MVQSSLLGLIDEGRKECRSGNVALLGIVVDSNRTLNGGKTVSLGQQKRPGRSRHHRTIKQRAQRNKRRWAADQPKPKFACSLVSERRKGMRMKRDKTSPPIKYKPEHAYK